jgi:hypothetical protein
MRPGSSEHSGVISHKIVMKLVWGRFIKTYQNRCLDALLTGYQPVKF